MQPTRWEEIAVENISPTVERQVVWGKKGTLARFSFAKDTHVSRHKHEAEQHTCILQGAMRLRVGTDEVTMRAGDLLVIPSWVEHEVWVLEDSVVWDFFAPGRQDWRDSESEYLKGG